ncbi:HNH endonuclease signature motif containing protein, partial [Aliivibrio sp. S3MY1]|uniref:HNH endonuclease n=1 Tax=unclassified Aliivibrio TaxID=2645654 RepID=UPI002377F94D
FLRGYGYMSISNKVRKKLWAKSGNRCAICKTELFSKEDAKESLNIGEECHIISSAEKGPRHKSGIHNYDTYENLVLLCRNHHIEVDTLTDTYPEELLMYMKVNHENWVTNSLEESISKESMPQPKLLTRITSGKEVLNIIAGIDGFGFDYDEGSEEDNEFIGSILQTLTDYAEIIGMDVGPFERTKIATHIGSLLKELEFKGYFLFAERCIERLKCSDNITNENWITAKLYIKKNDSPDVTLF